MDIDVVTVPFHLDREDVNTGAGPARLLDEGAEKALADAGHTVRAVHRVELEDQGHETGNIFANMRSLSDRVSTARREGAAPVILAGDCHSAIGVMSGLSAEGSRGLLWLDAHGDANTPETSESGFFDGFPLAVVAGWCWGPLAATVPGFDPLPESRVIHVGGRAFDGDEEAIMARSGMTVVDGEAMRDANGLDTVREGLERLGAETDVLHVHLDLDVLDRSDGVASGYATFGGPRLNDLEELMRAAGELCTIGSITICAYDPAFDDDGRAAARGIDFLRILAGGLQAG
jgi:arginase